MINVVITTIIVAMATELKVDGIFPPAPRPVGSLEVRVQDCRDVTARIKLVELVHAQGHTLPPYSPGAHIRLPIINAEGKRDWRSYSLIEPHAPDRPYRVAVQREDAGRGGSRYLHEQLTRDTRLDILPPANFLEYTSSAR